MAKTPARIPKYFQISRDIIARIDNGELAPGSVVPSENEIIRQYEVSNTTARKALHEVEQAGWVARIKGRGTFVRRNRVDRSVDRILGFTRNMIEAGREPRTQVLSVEHSEHSRATEVTGREYVLPGPIWIVRRLRLADEVPMMIETRYVSAEFCPDMAAKDLTGSLYDIYERHYDLQLAQVDQVLSTVLLSADQQALLGVDTPLPAFQVEGVTFCGKELILEMEQSIYRGDIYRFSVNATRGGNTPRSDGRE